MFREELRKALRQLVQKAVEEAADTIILDVNAPSGRKEIARRRKSDARLFAAEYDVEKYLLTLEETFQESYLAALELVRSHGFDGSEEEAQKHIFPIIIRAFLESEYAISFKEGIKQGTQKALLQISQTEQEIARLSQWLECLVELGVIRFNE